MKLKEVVEGGTRFNKHAEKWKFSPTSHASQQLETGRPAVRQNSPLITTRHERGNTPLWACRDGGASGAGTRVYCAGITPDRDTDPFSLSLSMGHAERPSSQWPYPRRPVEGRQGDACRRALFNDSFHFECCGPPTSSCCKKSR